MSRLLKERVNPCCGLYLQSIVPRIVPILQFIFMLLGIIFLIIGIVQNFKAWKIDRTKNQTNHYLRLALWISYVAEIIITDALAYLLWKACKLKNPALIRIWIVCSPLTLIYMLACVYTNIIVFHFHKETHPGVYALVTGYGAFQFYLVYVVYCFMKEMEFENQMNSAMRFLTDAEINEFENGLEPPFRTEDLDAKTKNLMDKIQFLRYKREDFEILPENLQLDTDNPLGSGEYGQVYKGQYKRRNGETSTVAVKTVDPRTANVICFKALLTELKVMTYLGEHPNVLRLIGASTALIRERNLLIVVELCELGCLHNFLRVSRGLFQNQTKDGQLLTPKQGPKKEDDEEGMLEGEALSTLQLIKWSEEIASGMEYLSSLKIVHGDLAARNIVLDRKKVAKVCDFGLARQLYNYSVYVKKQNTALPWRHLSLESLTDMSFSTHSDVWAYGVTLFEIFSLAEVPYPGYNFSLGFLEELRNGLRPSRPPFATDHMWSIMERCWNSEPKRRPTFTEILMSFNVTHLTLIIQ